MAERLIDAEAAKMLAEEFYPFVEGCGEIRDVKDFLDCCPTIEAKPVVHAHWKYHGGDDDLELYGFCSRCGKGRLTEDDISRLKPSLCPYCSAQMDEVVG